jgi:hypothetical protein
MRRTGIAVVAVLVALVLGVGFGVVLASGQTSDPVDPPASSDAESTSIDDRVLLTPEMPRFDSWDDVPAGGVGCNQTRESTVSCEELYLQKMPEMTPVMGPDGEIHEVPTADIRSHSGTLSMLRADGTWGPVELSCSEASVCEYVPAD